MKNVIHQLKDITKRPVYSALVGSYNWLTIEIGEPIESNDEDPELVNCEYCILCYHRNWKIMLGNICIINGRANSLDDNSLNEMNNLKNKKISRFYFDSEEKIHIFIGEYQLVISKSNYASDPEMITISSAICDISSEYHYKRGWLTGKYSSPFTSEEYYQTEKVIL